MGAEMATHVHKITKVHVFYMLLGCNAFDGGKSFTWAVGRVGPKNLDFFARFHFRAQKVLISGPPLPMALLMDLPESYAIKTTGT